MLTEIMMTQRKIFVFRSDTIRRSVKANEILLHRADRIAAKPEEYPQKSMSSKFPGGISELCRPNPSVMPHACIEHAARSAT